MTSTTTTETAPVHEDGGRTGVVAPLVAGAVMVAFGVFMFAEAMKVEVGADLIRGPRLFPVVITAAWTVLSACYLGQQLLRLARRVAPLPAERFDHAARAAGVVALLVGYAILLDPIGYILTTFVLFVGVAALLGSRSWRRDLVVGVLLSVAIYFSFTQLLAVRLPAGVLGT